jgi:hypothetical protein
LYVNRPYTFLTDFVEVTLCISIVTIEKGNHQEDLDMNGRITLKSFLQNRVRVCGLDSSGSGYGPVVGFCEHGNENWGFIKSSDFLNSCANPNLERRT